MWNAKSGSPIRNASGADARPEPNDGRHHARKRWYRSMLAVSILLSAGVAYALAAGGFWALYIYFGRKAGAAHGGQTTALGMTIGAIVIVPIGAAQAGMQMLSPAILPAALGVALLSSAIPYSLEMLAMPRLPTRTVGVLMSLDPALGAVAGLLFLGESLSWIQWAAIASIMAASAGSAATGRDAVPSSLPD